MTTERGTSVAEYFTLTATRERDDADERDTVLVCAYEPLGSTLSELARAHGYRTRVLATPLQVIEALQDARLRVRHALISASLPRNWGRDLLEFLAEEYPHVRRVMLAA